MVNVTIVVTTMLLWNSHQTVLVGGHLAGLVANDRVVTYQLCKGTMTMIYWGIVWCDDERASSVKVFPGIVLLNKGELAVNYRPVR